MNQNDPSASTTRAVVVIALAAALIMVGALFLNSQNAPTSSVPPTAVIPASSAGGAAVGENCRELDPATSPVQTTASGLQYQVLRECDGVKPTAASSVTVHYRGTLVDGTEFDSSYSRGQPATFPLNGVIAGWTEGVQLMSVGSLYRFTIPPELGYGAAGAGGAIPPNATLNFDIELLGIQ